MKKSTKIWTWGIIILLAIIVFANIKNSSNPEPGQYALFAQCLTDNGATFYGSYQCPHCTTQKEMFGSDFQFVKYIECGPLGGPQYKECLDAKIEAYPTWDFADGSRITGTQSLPDLASRTGCSL